jgi:dynein assembly factor 3
MAGQIQASLGHYGFHGLSATFDLIQAIGEGSDGKVINNLEPLNVLLINPGDIRHILTTISRRRRHNKDEPLRGINFYLLESPIEVLARNILLLELINDYEVPIRQRATVYLEIFGNCRVQDRTAKYIEQLGHQLRSFIADSTGRLEGLVDLSLLKYKEKDDLDFAFRNYSKGVEFDIDTLRDHRLRGY